MKPDFIRCKCCNTEISQTCELAAYNATIDGRKLVFCCRNCAIEYKEKDIKTK